MHRRHNFSAALAVILFSAFALAQSPANSPDASFPPFQTWMGAVLTADRDTLQSLYSADPPAKIRVKTVNHEASEDIDFWLNLKPRSMKVEMVRVKGRPDRINLIFRAKVVPGVPNSQPLNITADQTWSKQGEDWRLISVERTDSPALEQPADMKKDLYPDNVDAHAEIREAEEKAAKEHKRLLLIFGANWCFDCHVLDLAFQRPDLAPILAANYEVVHIDVGPDSHKNADLAQQFDVSLAKGVPTMAVIEADGKVLVSEKNGEVEDARQLTPEFLVDFLNKWKPNH